MKIAGDAVLHGSVDAVWDALLDPAVLVRTIPGCERLETTGEHRYAMTVTAGVASIRGTYAGAVELRDLRRAQALTMKLNGSGSQGTIGADVAVSFGDNGDGTTRLTYDADAVVGGAIGGVGQRMLTSVSKRMAGDFFTAVDRVLTGQEPAAAPAPARAAAGTAQAGTVPSGTAQAAAAPSQAATAPSSSTAPEVGTVFTAPARAVGRDDFTNGLLLGGGLVLLGVIVGVIASRRRR